MKRKRFSTFNQRVYQMTTMTSYAEGRIGAEEYTTQDAKQAYAVLGSGEPDYTLQIGGTHGYAESEMDKRTYLEQKMNGEYATGVEVVGQEDYAIQTTNGEYALGTVGRGDTVSLNAEGDYVVLRKDEEGYIKQDSNGPYAEAKMGYPDYTLASAEEGYATTSTGSIYSQNSNQGPAYSTSGFTVGDYVHASS